MFSNFIFKIKYHQYPSTFAETLTALDEIPINSLPSEKEKESVKSFFSIKTNSNQFLLQLSNLLWDDLLTMPRKMKLVWLLELLSINGLINDQPLQLFHQLPPQNSDIVDDFKNSMKTFATARGCEKIDKHNVELLKKGKITLFIHRASQILLKAIRPAFDNYPKMNETIFKYNFKCIYNVICNEQGFTVSSENRYHLCQYILSNQNGIRTAIAAEPAGRVILAWLFVKYYRDIEYKPFPTITKQPLELSIYQDEDIILKILQSKNAYLIQFIPTKDWHQYFANFYANNRGHIIEQACLDSENEYIRMSLKTYCEANPVPVVSQQANLDQFDLYAQAQVTPIIDEDLFISSLIEQEINATVISPQNLAPMSPATTFSQTGQPDLQMQSEQRSHVSPSMSIPSFFSEVAQETNDNLIIENYMQAQYENELKCLLATILSKYNLNSSSIQITPQEAIELQSILSDLDTPVDILKIDNVQLNNDTELANATMHILTFGDGFKSWYASLNNAVNPSLDDSSNNNNNSRFTPGI